MTELLNAYPESFVIATALAVAFDLMRRPLTAIGARWRAFFVESAMRQTPPVSLLVDLAGWILLPVLACIGFIPALVIIVDVATLMGVSPATRIADLQHGVVLLWLLVVPFLWLQVWHLMGLAGFFRRCRYLLLLVAVPLLAQIAAWLALAARPHPGGLAHLLAHLFCLGVLPFVMPVLHTRVLAPLFTAAGRVPRTNWRRAVVRFGNVLLVAATAATIVWYSQAARGTLGATAGMAYQPAPHILRGPSS